MEGEAGVHSIFLLCSEESVITHSHINHLLAHSNKLVLFVSSYTVLCYCQWSSSSSSSMLYVTLSLSSTSIHQDVFFVTHEISTLYYSCGASLPVHYSWQDKQSKFIHRSWKNIS